MNRKLDLTYSKRAGALAAFALATVVGACSGEDPPGMIKPPVMGDDGGVAKPDGGTKPEPPVECEGDFCDSGMGEPPPCAADVKLTANTTNVMFLIDGSASMAASWNTIREAMVKIINANPSLNFGAHVFYAPTSIIEVFSKLNVCGEMMHPRVEVGANNGQAVVNAVGQQPPGGGVSFLDTSPVLGALNWYLENDTPLADPKSANFLVVVSDLVDTCFGTFFSNPDAVNDEAGSEQLLAFQKLAVELRKRNINTLPIGFAGTRRGGGPGAAGKVNEEALKSLTKLGGSSLSEPLIATNDADIQKAIDAISVAVQPCRFTIPAAQQKDAFKLSFLVNNNPVTRDRTNESGWNFVQGNTQEVQFYADACRAIQAGKPVQALLACDGAEVCGTGARQLETKDRALHVLLDGSASMWGNVFDVAAGKLTPWGQATSALSSMVTAPINDDLEFGFQFFPKGADPLSCMVDAPEVNAGPSSEISIIEEMVGNVPQGSTPLVSALQYTAANPGRLAEKDVLGTVLLVSDGGDSCSPDATTRANDLAVAATSLFNAGVKTYAVRFGSPPTPEEDIQLQNIALNGGTEKYLTAPDGKVLTEILSKLSTDLFSCGLKLKDLPDTVDPLKANVYLNGTLVPFDDKGANEGWHWTSDTANGDFSGLELLGQACESLRMSRLSDIVIEFGCAVIPVE